jgi:hypothetical protein
LMVSFSLMIILNSYRIEEELYLHDAVRPRHRLESKGERRPLGRRNGGSVWRTGRSVMSGSLLRR